MISGSAALSALVERRVPGLAADLQALLDDPALRGQALRALAAYDDPATPEIVLSRYGEYLRVRARRRDRHPGRPPGLGARACWRPFEHGQDPPPRRERLGRPAVPSLRRSADQRAARSRLGQVQPTSKAKAALVAKYKAMLASDPDPAGATRREGGPSSTGPASRATGSMTPAATSAPS